jgi:hypothetical protein
MTTERCSTCSMPTVYANGRLICPRPACPGHTELAARLPVAASAQPAAGLQRRQANAPDKATVGRVIERAQRAATTDTPGGRVEKFHDPTPTPRPSLARASRGNDQIGGHDGA